MQTTEIGLHQTGCWLDNHRGHYISRDVVTDVAQPLGFIVGLSDQYVLDRYESDGHADDYPFEVIVELSDEAIRWLNAGDERIDGQNPSPKLPDGYEFDFNDGDFGLYSVTAEVRVEDAYDEHETCPDCGNAGTIMTSEGYRHCVRYLSCWTD